MSKTCYYLISHVLTGERLAYQFNRIDYSNGKDEGSPNSESGSQTIQNLEQQPKTNNVCSSGRSASRSPICAFQFFEMDIFNFFFFFHVHQECNISILACISTIFYDTEYDNLQMEWWTSCMRNQCPALSLSHTLALNLSVASRWSVSHDQINTLTAIISFAHPLFIKSFQSKSSHLWYQNETKWNE